MMMLLLFIHDKSAVSSRPASPTAKRVSLQALPSLDRMIMHSEKGVDLETVEASGIIVDGENKWVAHSERFEIEGRLRFVRFAFR
jgi:hypothetical protein